MLAIFVFSLSGCSLSKKTVTVDENMFGENSVQLEEVVDVLSGETSTGDVLDGEVDKNIDEKDYFIHMINKNKEQCEVTVGNISELKNMIEKNDDIIEKIIIKNDCGEDRVLTNIMDFEDKPTNMIKEEQFIENEKYIVYSLVDGNWDYWNIEYPVVLYNKNSGKNKLLTIRQRIPNFESLDNDSVIIRRNASGEGDISDYKATIDISDDIIENTEITEEVDYETKMSMIQEDNEAQELVIDYYSALTLKDFAKAVNLSNEKTEESLSKTYSNIKVAIPYNIKRLEDGKYGFDIYYVEEGSQDSITYEVVKKIKDGKLYSVSSKVKETISPSEFIINSGKYIVFKEGEQKVKDFFGTEGRAENRAKESLNYWVDLTEEKQAELDAKIKYFENFLSQYNDDDLVYEYRIVDKSYIDGDKAAGNYYAKQGTPNVWRQDMTEDGLRIYVIKNKGTYADEDDQFFVDFSTSSGIPNMTPLKVNNNYLVIENYLYCGASICPFQASEIREMVKSEIFMLQ